MIARAHIVVAAEKGRATSKPRPWLVIQATPFAAEHPTVTVCMVTTAVAPNGLFRLPIEPETATGLEEPSVIAIDAIHSLARSSIDRVIGRASPDVMAQVDMALRCWLDL